MKRKGLITILAFLFAVTPLLGAAAKADSSEAGNGNNNKVMQESENDEGNDATQTDNEPDVASASDMKALVEQLADEGEFENDQAIHALTLHLTAVSHYEKQDKSDKVVKHMKGFKVLLDHQKENGLISGDAYDTLNAAADVLINKWDALAVVKDGQAHAVVVVPDDNISKEISQWGTWNKGTSNGQSDLALDIAHTGNASVKIQHMEHGNINQKFQVQPGPFEFQVYYYTPSKGESRIHIGGNLRDENDHTLKSAGAKTVTTADTAGEWHAITLQGEIPEEVNGKKVEVFQALIYVLDQQDVPVYVDDASFYQKDQNLNMLENPGFEEIDYGKPVKTLVEYVQKSADVGLPVVTEAKLQAEKENFKEDTRIYIGGSAPGDDIHIEDGLKNLNDQGFLIYPHDQDITIVGPTDDGTMNGVYEFLERYVGVRWLLQGQAWEDVPSMTDVRVPRKDVREEPAFNYRFVSTGADEEWSKENKIQTHDNRPIEFLHNLYSLFPIEKYGETHPEFYPNGNPPDPDDRYHWQPCFTADGTVDVAVSGILDYFDKHPDATSYSLGINDSTDFCEADPDNPYYPGKKDSLGHVYMSDIYYKWVNEVVEQVLEVYPDKWFGLLAYANVIDPPSFKLNSHVIPFRTRDRMTWIDDDVRSESHQIIEEWNEKASQIGMYDLMYGAQYAVPRVYPHLMADVLKYANQHNGFGFYTELYQNAGEGPKEWLYAKLLWDPNQDVDALLNEWYVRAVGEEAAPDLRAYYDLWENFWTKRIKDSEWFQDGKGNTYLPFKDLSYLRLVTKADLDESRQLMDSVVAKAKTDQQKVRARQLQRMFKYYEASALSYPIKDEVQTPANEQAALQMLDHIKQSLEMATKRHRLIEEFESTDNPGLKFPSKFQHSAVEDWNGVQRKEFEALEQYVASEPDGGPVGEQVETFLAGLPDNIREQFLVDVPTDFSANAVKTTANQDEILQSLDFSQGPWKEAGPVTGFLKMGSTTQLPMVKTQVYLLWDDENLYVGYENFDPDLPPETTNEGWRGNSDQTILGKNPEGMLTGYFTDPDAVPSFFSQEPGSGPTSGTNTEWQTSTHIGADRWNTVQVIPFSSIGVDPNETNELWALFFRNYNDHAEYIGWGGGQPWYPEQMHPVHLVEKE